MGSSSKRRTSYHEAKSSLKWTLDHRREARRRWRHRFEMKPERSRRYRRVRPRDARTLLEPSCSCSLECREAGGDEPIAFLVRHDRRCPVHGHDARTLHDPTLASRLNDEGLARHPELLDRSMLRGLLQAIERHDQARIGLAGFGADTDAESLLRRLRRTLAEPPAWLGARAPKRIDDLRNAAHRGAPPELIRADTEALMTRLLRTLTLLLVPATVVFLFLLLLVPLIAHMALAALIAALLVSQVGYEMALRRASERAEYLARRLEDEDVRAALSSLETELMRHPPTEEEDEAAWKALEARSAANVKEGPPYP